MFKRRKAEFCALLKQIILNDPSRGEGNAWLPTSAVLVLNDAANLNVRKSEGLLQDLQVTAFQECAVHQLAVIGNDCAISMDGSGLQIGDVEVLVVIADLHVRILFALFGEDLNAIVIPLIVLVIVARLLTVENHGRSAGGGRLGGHLKFIR